MAGYVHDLPNGAPVPSLVRWGLSPDADLVYRALVTFGPRTAGRLAHDLGLPAARLSAAIDELAGARAVTGAPSRAAEPRWRAAPVADVSTRLRGRTTAAATDRAERTRWQHAFIGAHGGTPIGREHLGTAAVRHRIGRLVAAERHEHLALNPEPYFTVEAVEAARPLVRRLAAQGVTARECGVPGPDPAVGTAPTWAYRERPDIPTKLMVFDRHTALLPVDPADLTAGAIEVDHPAIVAATVALFEQLWSTARDPRKGGVPPIVLTSRENAIVALLAQGHTDASVAQRLNLSQRTIAYAMRSLMDRLGVENRFQLGLILGAAKVATPPSPRPEEAP